MTSVEPITGKEKPKDSLQEEFFTIEDVIDKTVNKLNFRLAFIFWAALSTVFNAGAVTDMTVMTGNIPYKDWTCSSKKCTSLYAAASDKETFFSQQTMCDNDFIAGIDFHWATKKTTFTTDWNIYCKNEAKLSTISGVYFFGGIFGLLCSTGIFDRIGRKKGALLGSAITTLATAASAVAPNYEALLVFRIMSGFGLMISYTGTYCWIIEFAPTNLRNIASGFYPMGWSISSLIFALLGYLIDKWQHIYLATAGICAFSTIMLIVNPLPESPRFHLVRGEEKEAKKCLLSFFQATGNRFSFEGVNLIYEKRVQNYFKQVSDFKRYPAMLKRTLLCMLCWFFVSIIGFAYTFGWSKIGSNLYTSYLLGALGGSIGNVSSITACKLLGRKGATIFFFGGIAVFNFIAMVHVQFSESWTLEYVASLIGSISGSAAFAMVYLYTGELSPTSHRGMIMCLSSSSARVGSFLGPYVSLLYGVTDRRVPLALFAGLAFCGCLVSFFLPDTTGVAIPETPKDIKD
ncbi:solute carrier family 22 member 7-like [Bolinopsis microptera]|uniref:solute carrier family 22 member 7-like n=1 Tax=Bolinopsis microptera TaxID=2820187 RepID=UPI00307961E9